jgi:hypothetical protein
VNTKPAADDHRYCSCGHQKVTHHDRHGGYTACRSCLCAHYTALMRDAGDWAVALSALLAVAVLVVRLWS